jgi:hypothetical protein
MWLFEGSCKSIVHCTLAVKERKKKRNNFHLRSPAVMGVQLPRGGGGGRGERERERVSTQRHWNWARVAAVKGLSRDLPCLPRRVPVVVVVVVGVTGRGRKDGGETAALPFGEEAQSRADISSNGDGLARVVGRRAAAVAL